MTPSRNQATRHPSSSPLACTHRRRLRFAHSIPSSPLQSNYEYSQALMRQFPQQMASLQILKSTLWTTASVPRQKLRLAGKSRDGVLRLRVSCKADEGEKLKNGNGKFSLFPDVATVTLCSGILCELWRDEFRFSAMDYCLESNDSS